MTRNRKPRKPYRRLDINRPSLVGAQLWRLDTVFGPLEAMLRHVERQGTLDVSESGMLTYFVATHGRSYEVVPLMETYAYIFGIARGRDSTCPLAEPLMRVASRLDAAQLEPRDIADCLRCLADLRAYVKTVPLQMLSDIISTAEIKIRMEALEDETTEA